MRRQNSGVSMDGREFGVRHLAVSAVTTKLAHCFDQMQSVTRELRDAREDKHPPCVLVGSLPPT